MTKSTVETRATAALGCIPPHCASKDASSTPTSPRRDRALPSPAPLSRVEALTILAQMRDDLDDTTSHIRRRQDCGEMTADYWNEHVRNNQQRMAALDFFIHSTGRGTMSANPTR